MPPMSVSKMIIRKFNASNFRFSPSKTAERFAIQDESFEFQYSEDGCLTAFYQTKDRSGKPRNHWVDIASRFFIIGEVALEDGTDLSLALLIIDKRHRERILRIHKSQLLYSPKALSPILTALIEAGLSFGTYSKTPQLFIRFLRVYSDNNAKLRELTLKLQSGWTTSKGAFVMPGHVILRPNSTEDVYEELVSQSENTFGNKGSLEEWIEKISLPSQNSSRLSIAICLAFAAPLLPFSKLPDSGGLHIFGPTSVGKSLSGRVASSVMGEPDTQIIQWKATEAGLESIAAQRNHCLLTIDELGQANPEMLADRIYLLGNGTGKLRGTLTGSPASQAKWHCMTLSNGEFSLPELAKIDKKYHFKSGQEVRLTEIPACVENGTIFEELPENIVDSNDLLSQIGKATNDYYGTVGKAWIKELVRIDQQVLSEQIEQFYQDHQEIFKKGTHSIASRVGKRFALLAYAGEKATQLGLTGWREGFALSVASRCFSDWWMFLKSHEKSNEDVLQHFLQGLLENLDLFSEVSSCLNPENFGWIDDLKVTIPSKRFQELWAVLEKKHPSLQQQDPEKFIRMLKSLNISQSDGRHTSSRLSPIQQELSGESRGYILFLDRLEENAQ